MRILLNGEADLTVFELDSPGFEVEVAPGVHAHYSAMQRFAHSLALCTASVLVAYAEQIDAPTDSLAIRVRWEYVEPPFRIGRIDMQVYWPQLPESRLAAAQRAARHCTLHHTLERPPVVLTDVNLEPAPTLTQEKGAQPPAPQP
ncbi:MAG: OsmC family protein [Myxococcales bacterium]|jgi:uncharacterized OsmC-like protein